MRYTYILLDSDNTLMDFDAAQDYAICATLREYGISCTKEVTGIYETINGSLWEEYNHGRIRKEILLTERFRRFFETMGFETVDYEKLNQRYLMNLGECPALIPGALEFCREMSAKAELYILTNGVTSVQTRRFEASPLKDYIREIFISEAAGYQKPQREYFNYVFEKINGFEKEKAIMIGDSLTSDIKGANNAGIASCWYNPGRKSCDDSIRCDYIVKDYEQMKAVFEETHASLNKIH